MPNAKRTNRTDNRILCNSTSGSGNDGFREHLFSAHTTPPRCTVHMLTKYEGQVGYVKAGMKEVNEAQIGDTLYHQKHPIEALPGFKPAKAMVFAGTLNRIPAGHVRERHKRMYPIDQSDYSALCSAVEKLTLNDSSLMCRGTAVWHWEQAGG